MIFLTGSTGFIGSFLMENLHELDSGITPLQLAKSLGNTQARTLDDLGFLGLSKPVSSIIHCAGISSCEGFSDEVLQAVNVDYPVNLIRTFAQIGLKKFIFLSSLKVLGDSSPNTGFSQLSCLNPQSRYAASKAAAENALRVAAEKLDVQLVIIRMPVVYGPRMKGNFLRIFDLINRGVPIPVSHSNKRAVLAVYNLADFVRQTLLAESKEMSIYNIFDSDQPSSYELVRLISASLRKPFRPILCSEKAQKLISYIPMVGPLMEKNFDNNYMALVDPCDNFTWKPVLSIEEGLQRTARWYLTSQ